MLHNSIVLSLTHSSVESMAAKNIRLKGKKGNDEKPCFYPVLRYFLRFTIVVPGTRNAVVRYSAN